MLVTPQRFPRAGSQSYPSPAAVANADGSTTVHFAPEQPAGVADGNWIQTMPGKGFFPVLRLYSPLQPFFDKSWHVGEVEPPSMSSSSRRRYWPCSRRSSGVRSAASALLVGALVAYVTTPSPKFIAVVMALGAGLLIGSISFELIDEALEVDRGRASSVCTR